MSVALEARTSSRVLGASRFDQRQRALEALDTLLAEREPALLAANRRDLEAAGAGGLDAALLARLRLSPEKLQTLREGVRALVAAGDPLGAVLRHTRLDDGLILQQVRSPLGVVLVIFESRPDAVVQIGSLAMASGNAVLLKGGSEARHSNAALVACLRDALEAAGLPCNAVIGVEGRAAVAALLDEHACIDLVIPRGSGALVRSIQAATRIPVLGHAEGVCCLYLHRDADPAMAARVAVDGKTDYPSACNATELLLVDAAFLPRLEPVAQALAEAGVTLWADERARAVIGGRVLAPQHVGKEWGSLDLSVMVVDDLQAAVDAIHRHGSGHTEAIVTSDAAAAEAFLAQVDSASVFHNASTRFADGYRYGLGAEVGISTGRLHARGPVGVEGLTTTRWLLRGSGQCASDYGAGRRSFRHEPI